MDISRPEHAAPTRRLARQIRPAKPNLAGRPTAVELERRKTRVMDVAIELFVSRGYAATSLVDIAKGAGVATRTVYQHFGDKEALFQDVMFARKAVAKVQLPTLQPDDTLTSVLRRIARYACEASLGQESIDVMRLMVAESNRFPELIKKVASVTFARFRSNVGRLFEEMAERGMIPPKGDHHRSGELFSDLILGHMPIMTYTNWETALPTEDYIEERIALFVRGRFGPEYLEAKASAKPAKSIKRRKAARQAA